MNTIQKIAASAVAAAAIVGGVVGVSYLTDSNGSAAASNAAIDDVQPATVAIPRVEIPRVNVPQVSGATAEVPAVSLVRIISEVELEELDLPEIDRANVQVLASPGVKVSTPEVASYTDRMPQLIELQRIQQTLFRDQRNLQYDPNIGLDSASWTKWIAIYRAAEYQDYTMEYVELRKGLRIINEVKCPETSEQFRQLQANLDYYMSRKYNAVLVTFTTEESLSRLADVIDYLKSLDLTVIIAYGGRENLRDSVFRDPNKLAEYLKALGAKADALLLGWRRTSLHLFLPDKQWTNFLIKNARSQNARLAVIGMAYFGETAEQTIGVTYDVPANCSAVLVAGIGYPAASTKTAFRKLFPEIQNHPHKIGLVVGERPYFDSLHDTGKTRRQNDMIKRRIEIRLRQAGCDSTMTYSGDGGDGHYGRKDRTENLCLPYGN